MTLVYEQSLDQDLEWALSEGSRHFEQKSAVHDALHAIAGRLEGLGIPYAVVGGMALFLHGYRRFTEDVDLLVTAESRRTIHEQLIGLGYVPLFPGSMDLRDVTHGVRIEFLVTGGYPGDGKLKPVSFPDPRNEFVDRMGIRCLPLPRLIDLKLASGLSSPGRLRDLADVQEMIRHLGLARDYADQLNPSVREKFVELWQGVNQGQPGA
jgi:hypothetical protein